MKYLSNFDKFTEAAVAAAPAPSIKPEPTPTPVRTPEKPSEPVKPSKPTPPSRKNDPSIEPKPKAAKKTEVTDVIQRLQNDLEERGETLEEFYKKNKKS